MNKKSANSLAVTFLFACSCGSTESGTDIKSEEGIFANADPKFADFLSSIPEVKAETRFDNFFESLGIYKNLEKISTTYPDSNYTAIEEYKLNSAGYPAEISSYSSNSPAPIVTAILRYSKENNVLASYTRNQIKYLETGKAEIEKVDKTTTFSWKDGGSPLFFFTPAAFKAISDGVISESTITCKSKTTCAIINTVEQLSKKYSYSKTENYINDFIFFANKETVTKFESPAFENGKITSEVIYKNEKFFGTKTLQEVTVEQEESGTKTKIQITSSSECKIDTKALELCDVSDSANGRLLSTRRVKSQLLLLTHGGYGKIVRKEISSFQKDYPDAGLEKYYGSGKAALEKESSSEYDSNWKIKKVTGTKLLRTLQLDSVTAEVKVLEAKNIGSTDFAYDPKTELLKKVVSSLDKSITAETTYFYKLK